MGLTVYNTLTRQKAPLEPVSPGKIGIYLCGPTVYKPSHIGHAVGPIIFDAIKRYLVHRGYEVTLVVNITDVDDKLIDEAAKQNTTMAKLAERITKDYLDAMAKLHIDGIDIMPKASEHIGDIISIVQRLIERGVAYEVGGDVYFDVTRHDGYGKLSNRRARPTWPPGALPGRLARCLCLPEHKVKRLALIRIVREIAVLVSDWQHFNL